MRITLVQNEIEEALKQYVQSQGIAGNFTDINIIAGRGANGFTAEIDIVKGNGIASLAGLMPQNTPIPRAIESVKEEVAEDEPEQEDIPEVPVEGKSLFGS